LLALLIALAMLLAPRAALALSDAQQLVVETWRLVNQGYVEPARLEAIDWRRLRQKTLERPITTSVEAYDAIEAMLAPIGDAYTRLLRPEDYAALRSDTRGTVSGVGMQLGLTEGDRRIVVIAPLDDSPAAEAGIAAGWQVVAVNGRNAAELGLEGTVASLRGRPGTEVLLRLHPPAEPEREVVLKRRRVDLRPVRVRRLTVQGHRLGLLRITQFSEPVPEQVRQALATLTGASGEPPVEGLLLDLRNNPGGLVSAGVAVADAFLDNAAIVVTRERDGISAPLQAGRGQLFGGPMLTLVNGGTASASEILAGALQDADRSLLAGGRTFGKGLIQSLLPLGDGSGVAITVARYVTPRGRDIQDQGIEPDLELEPAEPREPGGRDDAWLQQAAARLAADLQA
jgi:carboxyl-terminal processing protease